MKTSMRIELVILKTENLMQLQTFSRIQPDELNDNENIGYQPLPVFKVLTWAEHLGNGHLFGHCPSLKDTHTHIYIYLHKMFHTKHSICADYVSIW